MVDVFTVRATGGGAAGKIDRAEVKRAALVLFDPSLGVQIQGLPSGRFKVVKGDDLDGIVQAVEWLSDEKGVYFSLNPTAVGRTQAVNAGAMVCRRWMLIDVDAVRDPDTNSNEDEHDAARDTAYRVMEHLTEQGWPLPVIVDSGNGFHLLYRLDSLPNTTLTTQLVKAATVRLAETFDNETANIDRKVTNANRISKLPGTEARKGPKDDERPWRMAKIVFYPEPPVPVTVEQLKAVGGNDGTADPTDLPKADPFTVHANGTDEAGRLRSYARAALEREVARVCLAVSGQRNNVLNTAAFSMGTLVGAGWILEQDATDALFLAATRAGLSEAETRTTIRSGMAAGKAKPRTAPEQKADAPAAGQKASAKKAKGVVVDPGIVPDGPLILRASKVTPRKVEWLWPVRIPLGKMTTFAGQGGLGKTFVLLDIASRVSRGLDWPDSSGVCSEVGNTLFISGEDDPDDTLVPRLMAMGADLERIAFLSGIAQDNFDLSALKLLTAAVGQLGTETRLVVIDPPTSYLAGTDDHKNSELRTLLTPLKEWAARARVAIVFNTHVNKAVGSNVDAASRIIGSVAWANAVRAAHMFAEDPDDDKRCLFCPVKLNVGKKRKGLAYRIKSETEGDDDGPATVEWLGEVDTTANQAMGPKDKNRKRMIVAADWLIGKFQQKREWASDELFLVGKEEGVSRSAIFEAKAQLDLPTARRKVYENGEIAFVWWVPDDWPQLVRCVSKPVEPVEPVVKKTPF